MLDVLSQVYDALLFPDCWPRIMKLLGPLFGTDKAMYNRVDRTFPSESTTEVIGLGPEHTAALKNRDLDQDMLWRAVLRVDAGSCFRSAELVPDGVFQRGPLYTEIAVPAGIDFVLGAVLENTPEFFANLCFMQGRKDFTDEQKQLLQLIAPQLCTTARIRRRIALGDAGRREALMSFDRARQAMVVLDRSGYAIYSNDIARRLLTEAEGLSLKFGRFLFQNISAQAEFERLVRLAMSIHGNDIVPIPHVVRVPKIGPGTPYAMSVIPLTSSADLAVLPDGAGCMILIYDLDAASPLPMDRLIALYRLTSAEARVCEALFRVGSVDAVAADLCVTRNTVRSHLKSVYAKFGIASQGQLMQRLANSLRLVEGIGRGRPGDTSQAS